MTTDISNNSEHAAEQNINLALLADITAVRAAVLLITAKLDADAGVTDTNYASLCNPAALTTIA